MTACALTNSLCCHAAVALRRIELTVLRLMSKSVASWVVIIHVDTCSGASVA